MQGPCRARHPSAGPCIFMTRINFLFPHLPPHGARCVNLRPTGTAFVDIEDFERINQCTWFVQWCRATRSHYARRKIRVDGKRYTQSMHREVLGLRPGNPDVDHINHNTVDNRKENLRLVTHRQNHENRRDQSAFGAGVQRIGTRFRAQARIAGRAHHVGMFDTPEEAQDARRRFIESRSGPDGAELR